MKSFRFVSRVSVGSVLLLVANSLVSAQATRTWVSGVGDDANPCSRTAPCKTFAGAISRVSAESEVSWLASQEFEGVTVTKSVRIDGTAAHLRIFDLGAEASFICGVKGKTVLPPLGIETINARLSDFTRIGEGELPVEDREIFKSSAESVISSPHLANVNDRCANSVRDQFTRNMAQDCSVDLNLTPTGLGTLSTVLDNVRIEQNETFTFRADDCVKATSRNSSLPDNRRNSLTMAG